MLISLKDVQLLNFLAFQSTTLTPPMEWVGFNSQFARKI